MNNNAASECMLTNKEPKDIDKVGVESDIMKRKIVN